MFPLRFVIDDEKCVLQGNKIVKPIYVCIKRVTVEASERVALAVATAACGNCGLCDGAQAAECAVRVAAARCKEAVGAQRAGV